MKTKTCHDVELPHVDRLLYLYSESNAEEPEVINFWEEQILQFCVQNSCLSFTPTTLIKRFTVNDIYPSSFMIVLSGLISRKNFLGSKKDLLADDVSTDTLQSLFSAISLWSSGPDTENQAYVPFKILLDIEEVLVATVALLPDHAVFVSAHRGLPAERTFAGLLEKAAHAKDSSGTAQILSHLSESDQQLLLRHMVKTKRAVLSADRTIAKILVAKPSSAVTSSFSIFSFTSSASTAAETVSEAEEATLRLQCSIHQVEAKVEELRASVQVELNKAKKCKAQGDSAGALFHLAGKRSREAARDKLLQSLVGLVQAQDAIGQSNINVLLTNAYRTAARGLKASREDNELSADSAAEAMDAFQEEMDEMSEISTALSGGLAPGAVGATEEEQQQLEDELSALMLEAEVGTAAEAPKSKQDGTGHSIQGDAPLPSVPTTSVARGSSVDHSTAGTLDKVLA